MIKQAYEEHDSAGLFPMMDAEQYSGLKEDIELNGCKEDIVLWRGKIIDGRNRLKACQEIGIEAPFTELADDADPWEYVISANMHRRHLSASQRAMVASKIADLKRGGDHQSEESKSQNCVLVEDAAKSLNVSERSVTSANQVRERGSDELIEAVESGSISVAKAATIAKSTPKKEQLSKATKPKRMNAKGREYKSKPDESKPEGFSLLGFRKDLLQLTAEVPEDSKHHAGLLLVEIGQDLE
ncbi:MAG: hypothetical protein JKY95_10565 [Planctomycetaceae bacterium]|nr:hypothetical protein [Planctomycetaceae bacterium]